MGCYIDTSARIMPNFVDLTNRVGWNALYYCQSQAITNGATYFGLQFGTMCFYDTLSTNLNGYGVVRPDSECSMVCSGNQPINSAYIGPNCGGIYRNSVYKIPVNF